MNYNLTTLFLVILILGYAFFRLFYTFLSLIHPVPEILGPDNNIASSKLEAIIEKAKEYFNISDWNVVYSSEIGYHSITNAINWKTKTINITKFLTPSVGYELDNILGIMWYCSRIIHKEKGFKSFNVFVNILITLFKIIFYCVSLMDIVIWVVYKNQPNIIYKNSMLTILYNYNILFFIAVASAIIAAVLLVFVFGSKESIETAYAKAVSQFVANECVSYHQDIVAARTYSVAWKSIYVPTFLWKSANLKYLGPFVVYK